MMSQQELHGNWNQLKGALQDRWGQLTDDDLTRVRGDINQLIGLVQQKTGEARKNVETFLESAMEKGASGLQHAVESFREKADCLSETAHHQYDRAAEMFADGLENAQQTVRRRPAESVAVCFGAGLIAGAVLGLMMRNRS